MNTAGIRPIVALELKAFTAKSRAEAAGGAAPQSLETLAATDYARIRRLASRFGIQGEEADDAAQEVFAKAWTYRAQFHGGSSLSTWLTRIALNHFSTRIKRDRVRWWMNTREIDVDAPADSNPRGHAQTQEAYTLAVECLKRLSRIQREAFVLRYFEEMSYAEAAEVLEISEGTVRARAFEARKNLREMLKEYEL